MTGGNMLKSDARNRSWPLFGQPVAPYPLLVHVIQGVNVTLTLKFLSFNTRCSQIDKDFYLTRVA